MNNHLEQRDFVAELRRDGRRLVGVAAPYGIIADLGYIKERIQPGAFDKVLTENNEVLAFVDHDPTRLLMLHIFSAMAEEEGRRISQRTKAALAVAKARGIKLGQNGKVLAEKNKEAAQVFAKSMVPIISDLKREGFVTVREITAELNRRGVPSREGAKWHWRSTGLLLKRLTTLSIS